MYVADDKTVKIDARVDFFKWRMYLWKAVVAKKKTVILNAFVDIHIHD